MTVGPGAPVSALLEAHGVPPSKAKLLRHVSRGTDRIDGPTAWLRGRRRFGSYVSVQNAVRSPYSGDCRYAFHFLKPADLPGATEDEAHFGLFVGATEILDRWPWTDARLPRLWSAKDWKNPDHDNEGSDHVWIDAFAPYEGRLVVEWPPMRSWFRLASSPDIVIRDIDPAFTDETETQVPNQPERLIYEAKVRARHLALERRGANPSLVKRCKGLVCEGCGLDAAARFGEELAWSCIEAHHLTPLAQARTGQVISSNPVEDFATLCATCHRLIHRMDDPADLGALKRLHLHGSARPVV